MRLLGLLSVAVSMLAASDYTMYRQILTDQLTAIEAELAKRPLPTKSQREAHEAAYIVATTELDRAIARCEHEKVAMQNSRDEINASYQALCEANAVTMPLKLRYEQAVKIYDEVRESFDDAAYKLALAKHAFLKVKQEKEWHEKLWKWHVEARVEIDRLHEELHAISSDS